ncbi:hypothetical protein [Polynucleobacter necessarius]|uniref:hypothetical protein n=1 Tax=Polynucleobacter necessarius TaxID=576610 RepID=UPI0018D571C5|nr:hypothetical protein [Polynucleobacter necessarius]
MEAQLKDSGASVFVMMENFASIYERIQSQTSIQQVIVSSPGELMGFKGSLINWVARRMKKVIPPWDFPHIKFKDALQIGVRKAFKQPQIGLDDIAYLCNMPAAQREFLKAQSCYNIISYRMFCK